MNTVTHLAPEEIMAFLDSELTSAEAQRVEQHVAECAECMLARNHLEETSQAMAGWRVPAAPAGLKQAVEQEILGTAWKRQPAKPLRASHRRGWMLAAGGAVAAVVVLGTTLNFLNHPVPGSGQAPAMFANAARMESSENANTEAALPAPPPAQARDAGAAAPAVTGPMIARTASLTIVVNNVMDSRAALDAILAKHNSYAAQITVSTPADSSPGLQASLRIPVSELPPSLAELRRLGQVQNETQGGEDVTQQHTDLAARLENARETESVLRTILEQRTGKMEGVLQVEEQISQTRGEIEQMEADQQALEHQVAFASVDLELSEVYQAQLTGSSTSIETRLRNSLVAGIHNAGSSVVGLAMLVEEIGPVMLVWVVILGVPAVLLWRRYRRVRTRV